MSQAGLNGKQKLLRIFVDEGERFEHKQRSRKILEAARESHLAGCTMVAAFAGYGPRHGTHTEFSFEGAGHFTHILEIVESPAIVKSFVENHEALLEGTLILEEDVHVIHYASSKTPISKSAHKSKSSEKLMPTTNLKGPQTLLRVFFGETDKVGMNSLHLDIIGKARKMGIAGCTVIRGIAGYGASSVVHEPHVFRLSNDLPLIVEIVDSKENVHKLLHEVEPLLKGTLVTEEEVHVHHYSTAPKKT